MSLDMRQNLVFVNYRGYQLLHKAESLDYHYLGRLS